jgi:hypothetical protein
MYRIPIGPYGKDTLAECSGDDHKVCCTFLTPNCKLYVLTLLKHKYMLY